MDSTLPQPGDILLGKYVVERVLGRGGMGIVVAAHHRMLGERVAIKFLSTAVGNGEAMMRFVREAQAAARLRSEHVARALDVGTMDDGRPYIVMEFLAGKDLAQVLEENGPLPEPLAVEYVLQACEALAEAHSIGIVHRDIKPANLFLTLRPDGSPCVKVLDFGISKVATPDGMSLTRTHGMLGSPLYMSPEQLRSARDVDPRADVYSLGVVLFELLTKRAPFVADTLPQLVVHVMHDEAPRASALRSDLAPALDAAVAACLVKERDQRTASIAELAQSIAPFGPPHALVSVERVLRISVGSSHPRVQSVPTGAGTLSALGNTTPIAMDRGRIAGIAVTLATLFAVGSWFAFRPAAPASSLPTSGSQPSAAPLVVEAAPRPSASPSVTVAAAPTSVPLAVAPTSVPLAVAPASAPKVPPSGPSSTQSAAKVKAAASNNANTGPSALAKPPAAPSSSDAFGTHVFD